MTELDEGFLAPYPKINAPYKRDEKGNFLSEFSRPEFEYLYETDWLWTEKIDGSNVRMGWYPGAVNAIEEGLIRGRTDKASFPKFLEEKLIDVWHNIPFSEHFDGPVTLYGEGYGARIQKGGGNYIPDGVDFILFDVKIGNWWLNLEDVQDVGQKLGVQVVPVRAVRSLRFAEKLVSTGFESWWMNVEPEGLVGRPMVQLFNRKGERIMTKLKRKDYTNESS